MSATELLPASKISYGNTFTLRIANPLIGNFLTFAPAQPKGTVLTGDPVNVPGPVMPEGILSVDENGGYGIRPLGTAGGQELATDGGNGIAVYKVNGRTYEVPFRSRD